MTDEKRDETKPVVLRLELDGEGSTSRVYPVNPATGKPWTAADADDVVIEFITKRPADD